VVATVERGPDDWQILFNNSYTLGGSKAQFNQERQAHLPLLLHGRAKTVATLGVATGSTVAGASSHPGVERIDAVELSPLVLGYAREYFGPYNRDVFRDPRVRFVAGDARWVMARRHAAYDVVVGDLFLPWRTGEGRLFALEHFRNVKHSLKPGGRLLPMAPDVPTHPATIRGHPPAPSVKCSRTPTGCTGRCGSSRIRSA
jgi:spermidine synthase